MSINNGWLQRDPFYAYSITNEETKRGFLSKEEIKMLIEGSIKKKSYELIRELFIFCCFTGLSWTDMANLTKENLQTSFDGHLWIKTNRQKIGTETNLRLLEVLALPAPVSEGQEKKQDLDTFKLETIHTVNPNKDFICIRPENGYNKGRKI